MPKIRCCRKQFVISKSYLSRDTIYFFFIELFLITINKEIKQRKNVLPIRLDMVCD